MRVVRGSVAADAFCDTVEWCKGQHGRDRQELEL